MVIKIVDALRSAELNGRLAGRRHFAQLCSALASTPPAEVVLLDFSSVQFVTGSWINACMIPLLRWSAEDQHDLYPVVTSLAQTWLDEFRLVMDLTSECVLIASADLGKGDLVGSLDPAQEEALGCVQRLGQVTGAGLERQCQGPVKATAWNNRLKALNRKRLIKRISQGREQLYTPVIKDLKHGRQLQEATGG